jgi:hypothetical protein
MGTFRVVRAALGVTAALTMFVGCSGGNSPGTLTPNGANAGSQSAQRHSSFAGRSDNSLLAPGVVRISHEPIATASFLDPKAGGKPLVFVSDSANGVIDIYPQAGKRPELIGQITGLTEPQGITTDKSGNLYVANTNSSNVLVYAPPYTGAPTMTIPDPGEFPADVAVSSAGVIAITNICSAPNCLLDSGNVMIFAKGATKSCATVSDSAYNFTRVMFAEFDKNGALYIDGMNGGYQTSFGLVTGGCQANRIANLTPLYTVSFPGGIQIDKTGRIAFCDPYRNQVATFDPPVDGWLAYPVTTTPLNAAVSAVGIAILASGADIYAADSSGAGSAEEYQYTAGGAPEKTIATGGQPVGIAVTPPLTKETN